MWLTVSQNVDRLTPFFVQCFVTIRLDDSYAGSSGAGTGVQASPLPLQRLQLEESLNGPSSPRSTSIQHRRESHVLADISENETLNSEQAVQNIAAMFPTVDEAHIRDLLRK